MAQLIVGMILCCHWFGCLWWLVSELETAETSGMGGLTDDELMGSGISADNQWVVPSWLKEKSDFGIKYSHALLWGAGMVTAMVPYDVIPHTTLEAYVTFISMFFGLLFNAIIISSLTTALTSMNSKKELAGKQLDTIRNYLTFKSVPSDLRSRILEYYDYLLTSSQALANSINYDTLPVTLAAQLALSINRKLAARCSLFREVSNESFVKVISELQPLIFVPAQLIVFEGHPLASIYFINRGLVQLLERMQPTGLLRDNENFGIDDYVQSLATSKPPVWHITAKAVGYCDVMTLPVERLAEILQADMSFQAKAREGTLVGQETAQGRWKRTARLRLRGAGCIAKLKARANTQALPDAAAAAPAAGRRMIRGFTSSGRSSPEPGTPKGSKSPPAGLVSFAGSPTPSQDLPPRSVPEEELNA